MVNDHCLLGLKVYAHWRPPTMQMLAWSRSLACSYFGSRTSSLVDETSSVELEFVPDNIRNNELALSPTTCCCCWVASNAASRRIRSCWYCISLWRSRCRRYCRSCWIHHITQIYSRLNGTANTSQIYHTYWQQVSKYKAESALTQMFARIICTSVHGMVFACVYIDTHANIHQDHSHEYLLLFVL